jgi:hypothetical protein
MRGLAVVVPLLLAGGCVDDIIKQFVPVNPVDGEVPLPDAALSSDADGYLVDNLSINGATPGHGPFVGGTEVVLSGTGFFAPLKVTVGGKAVQDTDIRILSPIGVEIITPAGEVGPADIVVESKGDSVTLNGGFWYDPVRLDPERGPTAGGTLVTIEGRGTDFKPDMTLTLGGQPMTEVQVISATLVKAKTPPGSIGPVDLVFSEPNGNRVVQGAYTYYDSTDPKAGGMGGGPLAGTLTVSTLDWLTRQPVEGATVVVQKQRELTLQGSTDKKGVAVFTDPKLVGKVTVTAAKEGYEAQTVVTFDARDLTMFLMPIIKPQPGPLPPGTLAGIVKGHVLFGGVTGAGSSEWKLVPEPKEGQKRRIYVYSTVPTIFWGVPPSSPNATMDDAKDGATAWPFTLVGYTGALAIYAVAGIYTEETSTFEPYAMGVTRGVVVGPGEVVVADVMISVPLSQKIVFELKDVPAGMAHHSLTLGIDLGADGLILLDKWDIAGDGVFTKKAISRLPLFNSPGLVDATFTYDLLLESAAASGLPYTRATERSRTWPKTGTFVVDEFIGPPLALKPKPGTPLQGNTLAFTQTGAKHDLGITVLRLTDETPVWRIITPGTTTTVKLPDPGTFGLPEWPKQKLLWLQWLARLPGFDYDTFNYNHLGSSYWDRWAFDELELEIQ